MFATTPPTVSCDARSVADSNTRKVALSALRCARQIAVALEPRFGEAQYQLGLALVRAGRQKEGQERVKQGREMTAASQKDQNILLDMSEGNASLAQGNIDDAISKFRRVLAEG